MKIRQAAWAFFLLVSLLSFAAAAQESAPPKKTPPEVIDPAEQTNAEPDETEDSDLANEAEKTGDVAPPEQETAPKPQSDPPHLVAGFDQAVAALIAGEFEAAAQAFEEVAAASTDPQRKAAAQMMAAQSRARATKSVHSAPSRDVADRSLDRENGRSTFLAATIIAGLNYGYLVPLALDIDDPKAFIGTYMLTAATSFVVPYLLTREDNITKGMSTLGGTGAFLGVSHAALAWGVIGGADGYEDYSRGLFAAAVAGSIIESTAGYLWARESNMPAGKASAVASGSAWGLGYAAGLHWLIQGADLNVRGFTGSMLAGSALGIMGGAYYGDWRNPTEGDIQLTTFPGVIGAYAGIAPLVAFEVDNPRAYAGALLAGATLGLVLGDKWTAEADYTVGEAGLVSLGSLAGGLLGAGTGLLLAGDDPERVIVPVSAAGAIGGLFLMRSLIEPSGTGAPSTSSVQLAPMTGENGTTGMSLVGSF